MSSHLIKKYQKYLNKSINKVNQFTIISLAFLHIRTKIKISTVKTCDIVPLSCISANIRHPFDIRNWPQKLFQYLQRILLTIYRAYGIIILASKPLIRLKIKRWLLHQSPLRKVVILCWHCKQFLLDSLSILHQKLLMSSLMLSTNHNTT